jgi:hypothetical protein
MSSAVIKTSLLWKWSLGRHKQAHVYCKVWVGPECAAERGLQMRGTHEVQIHESQNEIK